MSKTSCSLVLLSSCLLLCSASVSHAAGLGGLSLEPFLQSILGGANSKAVKTAENADVGREASFRRFAEGPAYLTIKFIVPPHEIENFVQKWDKLDQSASRDKGNIMFDLKKTITDNVYFLAYSEWESRVDLFYHLTGERFMDFVEYADEKNIVWELVPLKPVTDTKKERRVAREEEFSAENLERRHRKSEQMVHFLTKVILKPSLAEDFVQEWEETARKTFKEEGNAVYSLRQVARTNNEFYIYGTWDSYEDLSSHLSSKHVERLQEYAFDRDILFIRTPLVTYTKFLTGSEPVAV